MNIELIREFVAPYYQNQDIMHDLSHIDRIIITLKSLLQNVTGDVDDEAMILGAFFHGAVYQDEAKILKWLIDNEFTEERARLVLQIARESMKDAKPETLEGKLLHDAHMIECGRTFLIVKCLITGSVRGQTIEETIAYIEKNILGKGICYTDAAKRIYEQSQEFARNLIGELKEGLKGNFKCFTS